ncbi:TetR/AcrR family transcriptional regulator [Sodalis sp. RH24]|uniref:TetR/AcrR family transcriptional regulator n=1 Tax=unclassified Sodalis (in: enterobacteria) TaxID=2636512 RepID=UPI0039B38472
MGRQKKFSREGVLEKVIPVFWRHGFAGTTLAHLEKASGVNKSGLYAEFRDKDDLFLACLRHYIDRRAVHAALRARPQGWGNIEAFLRLSCGSPEPQDSVCPQGCLAVNSMREFALLPAGAIDIITQLRETIRPLLVENIRAEETRTDAEILAEMVSVFFSGLCIEQNLQRGFADTDCKIRRFMQALRTL